MYFVYMLECADASLYTGIATDVERRFVEHAGGKGARYTRAHKPVRIAYTEAHPNRSSACKREAAIKKLSSSEKRALAVAAKSSSDE